MLTIGNVSPVGYAKGGRGARTASWPPGTGDLARMIRAKDWSTTPLGPTAGWPERLRFAVETILDSPLGMVVLWGPDLIQLYNDAYRDSMGGKHLHGLGQPTAECWPETWEFNEPIYRAVFTGEHRRFDGLNLTLLRGGEPEETWFDLTYSPLRDDDGKIGGILVTVVETTEKHRVGEALVESEERFRCLVEASSQAVWEADADGTIGTDSASWRTYTGQNRDEWLGNRWLEAVHPDDRPRAEANWRDAVGTGHHMDVEFRLRHAGDAAGYRWTRVTAAPIRDGEGNIRKWVGMNSDVDARVRADRARRESEARWAGLVAGIPQMVWRAVDGGEWTWASPQWTAFTGQREEDSHGWGWLDPVHPDDRPLARRRWAEASARSGFAAKYRLCEAATGEYRWFQTRARPVFGDGCAIIEWLGTSTDIDDLQRLRQHERVLLAELQHRVRNTIAVIRSIARRTAEQTQDVESYFAHFDGRLGAFARTQSHVTRDPNAGVSLEDILRDELLSHHVAFDERVRVSGPEVRLTPRTADKIGLALHELATNAVKYGALSVSGGRLSVTWREHDEGDDQLCIEWREEVSEGIERPTGNGFGTEYLTQTLAYDLRADVRVEFRPEGLRCDIALPLSNVRIANYEGLAA